jgi:radical SAM-linked protein
LTIIRAWFTKTGEASYISLLDLQRVMQRAMKRSKLPVWYTLGFNPHIYMTFSVPLSLGQESLVESVDFKTEAENFDWASQCALLTECLPQGIDVVRMGPAKMDPGEIAWADYRLTAMPQYAEQCKRAFDFYNAQETAPVVKEGKRGKKKTIDLKEHLPQIAYTCSETTGAPQAELRLPAGSVFTLNPALLLGFLEQTTGLPPVAVQILRTALWTKKDELFC